MILLTIRFVPVPAFSPPSDTGTRCALPCSRELSHTRLQEAASVCTPIRPVLRAVPEPLILLLVLVLHLLLFGWLLLDEPHQTTGQTAEQAGALAPSLVMVFDIRPAEKPPSPPPPMPQAPARTTASQAPRSASPHTAPVPSLRSLVAQESPQPQLMPVDAPAAHVTEEVSLPLEASGDSSSAPAASHHRDTAGAASRPAASSARMADIEQRWQAEVLAHLEPYLRYPHQAQSLRQQGVAQVRFRVDRHGVLRFSALEHSSGYGSLDKEALAVLARAQPLPPPPSELAAKDFDVVLPITFRLRRR